MMPPLKFNHNQIYGLWEMSFIDFQETAMVYRAQGLKCHRLVNSGMELVTFGLQDMQFIHYAKATPPIPNKLTLAKFCRRVW